jgi:large subunit ribosomal protein L29
MELAKIRNLTDEELKRQETISAEQLFRIRFQVALGQNDGVKKLRQLRKEIAQVKTVARERELGIHTEVGEEKQTAPKAAKAHETAAAAEAKPATVKKTHAPAKSKTAKAKKVKSKAGSAAKAKTGKTKKAAAGAAKKKTGKKKGASK